METPALSGDRAGDGIPRMSTESKALLSQCRELARAKLSGIIADALDKIENDLFTLADASTSRAEQQVLFEAMSNVKQHRTEIARAFDGYFIDIFDQRIAARRATRASPQSGLALGELSLVDDSALEENLIVSDLARKTMNRIDPDQMLGIRARFGHLLSQDMLEDETNPLSPEAVFEALKRACAKMPGDFAVKRSLLNAFQPYVAAGITTVYADVNENLISHHVLPRIKHSVRRARDLGTPGAPPLAGDAGVAASQALNLSQLWAGAGAGQGGAGHPGGAEAAAPGAFGMAAPFDVAALLAGVRTGPPTARAHVTRMLADPSRYALEGTLTTPASPGLMTSLSALQASPLADDGTLDFMAALGDQVRAQSHPLDQLTIELVSLVFEYILRDKSVPETVKGEIARLQIVAVKAAILDRTFFARRQHPMRQLLDRIADVAADPEIATDEHSKFVIGLRGIVDDVVQKFTDDLTLFTVALDTLEKMIAEERASQQTELAPTTVELARKEEAEISHAAALAEVKRRVTRRTPPFVRDFLYNWWAKNLVDAHLHGRTGDDSWTERLGVVDTLVWSVAPLKTLEIQRLAAMLPTLMRSLLRGMNAAEMPADARHAFFNQLMQAHTASINAAKAQGKGGTAAAAEAMPLDEALVEPVTEEEPAPDIKADDYYLHTAMALERGAIVEFVDDDKSVRCTLSWVSPKQTILLFTSSLAGARQVAPKALAELLRAGRAQVVEVPEALMDRVVDAMMTAEAAPATA